MDTTRSDCFKPIAQSFQWGRASEEAATPGYPQTRISHLWKPSSSSPSRTAGTISSTAIRTSPATSHARNFGTLLEQRNGCNRKLQPHCAEAVEDESSLWKGKEKEKQISHGFHGSVRIEVNPKTRQGRSQECHHRSAPGAAFPLLASERLRKFSNLGRLSLPKSEGMA